MFTDTTANITATNGTPNSLFMCLASFGDSSKWGLVKASVGPAL